MPKEKAMNTLLGFIVHLIPGMTVTRVEGELDLL